MAYTQTQLDALKDAIARGARSVSHDGKTISFHSLDEMLALAERMERELQGSISRRPMVHYAKFSRGD